MISYVSILGIGEEVSDFYSWAGKTNASSLHHYWLFVFVYLFVYCFSQ